MPSRTRQTPARSTGRRSMRSAHPRIRRSPKKTANPRHWSASVMQRSDALDLDRGVFALNSPRKIAASLKRSAETSRRRKGTPYQSAMSMLNFYINRAGRHLSAERRRLLERVKPALREAFGRTVRSSRS